MEDVGLAVTIAWVLWSNRNDAFTKSVNPSGSQWSPPNYPSYKINVDATSKTAQKAVGASVIIQDHDGKFIAGLSKKFHAPLGIIEAEAKAFEAGIIFAKEVGIRDLVLEGDSLIILQALKQCSNAPSTISSLFYGMLVECNEFRKVSFSHVKRQGNRPAHILAKQALGLADFSAWIEECPCFLEPALVHDVFLSLSL
ncbi:uncharacterized protein LOC142639988 [Castanea sativa]|uniref:uncharacterized protein LOC142639988 n=1 Tax=Castanea sativa TaxID=21020 RepID=UPI003F64A9F7